MMSAGQLKRSSGWFAAGRETARALALLSDGAFRLYIHFCLKADRKTGRLEIDDAKLANAVDRSRELIRGHIEELQMKGVCRVESSQLSLFGVIEICDAFWPYQRGAKAPETGRDLAAYVAHIRLLMASRKCIVNSFGPADENFVKAL